MNLRGFDRSGTPVTPAEAVRGFLDAFGVSPDRVPHGLDAQTALYRSLLADRRAHRLRGPLALVRIPELDSFDAAGATGRIAVAGDGSLGRNDCPIPVLR